MVIADVDYPRALDRDGCLYGQSVRARLEEMVERMEGLEKKFDRLTQALTRAALTFGTAALMLALNLWLK